MSSVKQTVITGARKVEQKENAAKQKHLESNLSPLKDLIPRTRVFLNNFMLTTPTA